MITVERHENRIFLRTPWTPDEELFEERKVKCKQVDGARWRETERVWSYPLDWATCLELREVWGEELRIGPRLEEWANKEVRRRAGLARVAGMTRFNLERVQRESPVLARAMRTRTYQQVGTAFLYRAQNGLLADEPGLGKSLQVIGAVLESKLEGPVLVVAPAPAVLMTWALELETWVPNEPAWCVAGTREQRMEMINEFIRYGPGRKWLVINPQMLEVPHVSLAGASRDISYPILWEQTWAHIIVDESQEMLITRTGKVKDQSFVRQGLGKLTTAEGGLRIAMSGTPFRGKLENAWGTLNWLHPNRYTSYWRWIERWFDMWDDATRGTRVIGGLRADREPEFHKELDAIILRRTKEEVAPDLPPKMYAGRRLKGQTNGARGIWLPMTSEQKRLCAELRRDAAVALEDGSLMANGVLAELTRARQFAVSAGGLNKDGNYRPALPSNKFDWLVQWLAERGICRNGWGDSKVLVASQYGAVLELFAEALKKLGVETSSITGSVTGKRRVAAKTNFQAAGGPRVMLLTTKAGGVSLTLDAADDVIFLDETWVPDDQEQVEDRAHRVSRIHQVTIWYVRSLGSIEHKVATANLTQDEIQKHLLDGRRGVALARQLLEE